MNRSPLIAAWMLMLGAFILAAAPSASSGTTEFQEGQVWSYATRPNEKDSALTVVKIDRRAGEQPIIFATVRGLRVRFRASPNGPYVIQTQLLGLPFSEQALRRSVKALLRIDSEYSKLAGNYADFYLLEGTPIQVSVAEAAEKEERALNR